MYSLQHNYAVALANASVNHVCRGPRSHIGWHSLHRLCVQCYTRVMRIDGVSEGLHPLIFVFFRKLYQLPKPRHQGLLLRGRRQTAGDEKADPNERI